MNISDEEQQQAISQVLNQLVVFSKYDSTFRGIVGFPYSQTAVDAFSIYNQFNSWEQNPIPIISPSATTNTLNSQPNFYRVVSSDQIQTEAMVEFLEQRFNTKQQPTPTQIAIFVDHKNPYSESLYNSFISNINDDKPNIAPPSVETYTVLNPSTLKAPVADAIQKKAPSGPDMLTAFLRRVMAAPPSHARKLRRFLDAQK